MPFICDFISDITLFYIIFAYPYFIRDDPQKKMVYKLKIRSLIINLIKLAIAARKNLFADGKIKYWSPKKMVVLQWKFNEIKNLLKQLFFSSEAPNI